MKRAVCCPPVRPLPIHHAIKWRILAKMVFTTIKKAHEALVVACNCNGVVFPTASSVAAGEK